MAMMKDALTQKALSSDQDQWKRVGNSGAFSQFFSNFEHSNIGYGFYCFKNDSEKNIKVTVTLTQEQNIKVRKNFFVMQLSARFITPLTTIVYPNSTVNEQGLTVIECRISSRSVNIVIWDIFADASKISFKTSMSTY